MRKFDESVKDTNASVIHSNKSNKKKHSSYVRRNTKDIYKFNLFELCCMSIICIILGITIGSIISYNKDIVAGREVSKELREFILTYNNLVDNYYDKVKEEELSEAAISGMINSLEDPYTIYMEKDLSEEFNETVNGSYVGIGVTVQFIENGNKVIEMVKNGPAYEAGIKVNDIIVKVDGHDVSKLYGDDLTKYIKGKKGTKVKIKVLRNGKEKEFVVTRGEIQLDTATSRMIEKDGSKIGYLKIESFSENTFKQVKSNLYKLEKDGMESLIIDLRYNPGGHLSQARKILDLFFDKKVILYQIEEKGKVTKVYSSDRDKTNYPIVILANSETASASEILIGSLKENYKDLKIVGETTYGKGTIQKAVELTSGASFKYTTQKWLTPSGKSINKKGIDPDYKIILADEYYYTPNDENDNQLQKALELLV